MRKSGKRKRRKRREESVNEKPYDFKDIGDRRKRGVCAQRGGGVRRGDGTHDRRAYKGAESEENYITITCEADENARELHIEVADTGCGIENVEEALQPFFTTSGNAERSGMGFTIMQTFTDGCEVESAAGTGTKVRMKKKFGKKAGDNAE